MSSKYSVTKGNECVNYAEIYSFLMRERERAEPRRAPLSFFRVSSFYLFFLDHCDTTRVVPVSRSKVAFHRSTALAAFRCCCGLCYRTATRTKKKSSMPNAVLQECVPSTLSDMLNDRGRAIERNGVFFSFLLKANRHLAQQMWNREIAGTYCFFFFRTRSNGKLAAHCSELARRRSPRRAAKALTEFLS